MQKKLYKQWWFWIIAVILLIGIISLFSKSGSKNNSSSSNKDKTENISTSKQEKYYFNGKTAKLHDEKIEITKTKFIPAGEQGNEYSDKPILAIWYKVTNLTNKDIDPTTAWAVVFEAYQDNNKNRENKLNVGSLPDEKFLDSQMDKIKKNGTVENAVSYELDDTTTPVTLKATQGVGGKELGQKVYKLK